MDLGIRIKEARLAAGLSQRQLCQDLITRNMLSQIENGAARPSMATLQVLAQRLGKTVSFFLEEETVTSPNQDTMTRARACYDRGDFAGADAALAKFAQPDPVFQWEWALLRVLTDMALARQALTEDRQRYAADLLDRAGEIGPTTPYYTPGLERERLLLQAQARPRQTRLIAVAMPADDRELLLRAHGALIEQDYSQCRVYLAAAQDHDAPHWNYLQGECALALGNFREAAGFYHRCEEAMPAQVFQRLEQCYRELEDYKLAYTYAMKQK